MIQEGVPPVDPEATEPEEIRAEIEETRADLGETVEALAQKADVKSQAKAKVDERRQAVRQKQQEVKRKVAEIPGRARELRPQDAKRVASEAAEKARARPVPTIAAALGALLLLRLMKRG